MVIKTVEDYLKNSNAKGVEYCFRSEIDITSYGSKVYSIVKKPSNGDRYLCIRPLDRINNGDFSKIVHVPIWQHRQDRITHIPSSVRK